MHIYIDRDNLITALNIVQRAVSHNSPLPVLSGIMLIAKENRLLTSATDLEMGIVTSINASVQKEGSTVLPAKYISDLARRLPNITIEIINDPDSNTTIIRYGNSEIILHGFDSAEFPSFAELPPEPVFTVNQGIFRNMLKQVLFAVSTEEHRPVFTGVLFDLCPGALTLVANDLHRLALRTAPVTTSDDASLKLIVPGKTLNETIKLLTADEQLLSVYLSDNQLIFTNEQTMIISRLIKGNYPLYKQVIPVNFKCKFIVSTRDLLNAGERSLLLSRKTDPISIQVNEHEMAVVLNSDIGRIREELPISLEGNPMELLFNPRYLTEALKVIETNEVTIKFTSESSAAIIEPVGINNYMSLLLPTRLL